MRRNPRKTTWTQVYRRLYKKGETTEKAKRKTRKVVKVERPIVGASLDYITKTRNQKPQERQVAREAALR